MSSSSSPAHTPQRKKSDVATMADIRKFNPLMRLEGVAEEEDRSQRRGSQSGEVFNDSYQQETQANAYVGSNEFGKPMKKPVFDAYGNLIVTDSAAAKEGQIGGNTGTLTLTKHMNKQPAKGSIARGGPHQKDTDRESSGIDVLKFFHVDKEHTPEAMPSPPLIRRKSSLHTRRESVGRRGTARKRRSSIMNMSQHVSAEDSRVSTRRSMPTVTAIEGQQYPPTPPPLSSVETDYVDTNDMSPAAWITPEGDAVSFNTPSPPPSASTPRLRTHHSHQEKQQQQQQQQQDHDVREEQNKEKEKEKDKDKNIPRKYFTLELKNPQVNFLDQKSQSSMLIVVAGKSTVEGRKHREATVTVHGGGEIEAPKRKNDIELHMDGVSAYTVSTCDDDSAVHNRVYWKALDHTKIDMSQRTEGEIFGLGGGIQHASGERGRGKRTKQKRSIHTNKENNDIGGLRMAIEHFQIRFFHTFYEDITIMEAMKMNVNDFQRTKEDLMSAFFLDLPELCLKVDPLQFYIVLKVIRNVLLAPPPKQTAEEKGATALNMSNASGGNSSQNLSKRNSNSAGESKASTLHLKSSRARKELRELIEKELKSVNTEFSLAQHIEFFVGRGTWLMCDTGSSEVMLEVGFMGFFGRHQNHEDFSSSSEIELQRFWIRDCLGNSVGSAANTPVPPSPQESIYARIHQQSNKAVADVKKRLTSKQKQQAAEEERKRKQHEMKWALMPWLDKKDYCMRCGSTFNVKENSSDSCRFHADAEGTLGEYKEYDVYTGSYKSSVSGRQRTFSNSSSTSADSNDSVLDPSMQKTFAWSCCLNPSQTAVGCSVRPHLCQEVMVSIRTESRPSVSIANTFDFTVIEKLDIDIFPGAAYVIKIIITRQLVDMLHKYFYFNSEDIEKLKKEKEEKEGKDEESDEDEGDHSGKKSRSPKKSHQGSSTKSKSDKHNSDSESETSSKGGRSNRCEIIELFTYYCMFYHAIPPHTIPYYTY